MATNESLKNQLTEQKTEQPQTIQYWVKAYSNQISKALPSVLTPERFSRMVLTAITKTPKLAQCSPQSFIGAMLTAAQLGLEPNTPLGQAYLIPYGSECQFQVGYKGMIDLAYRSGEFQCIMSEIVYANDEFTFEYGLNANLVHKPCMGDRGEMKWVYAIYKLKDGGYSFVVKSIDDIIKHGQKYSKTYNKGPWQTSFEEMAKKTVIKQLLKYAPLKSEFARGISADETINEFNVEAETPEIVTTTAYEVTDSGETVDKETGEVKKNE